MRNDRRVPGQICGVSDVVVSYVDGKDWILRQHPTNPLRFVAAVGDRILTPPDNYVHDFATVPRLCWWLIGPPTGAGPGSNYGPAAILHDWAYEHQAWDNGEPLKRWEADGIFWEAMMDLNVDERRCEAMYKAVSFFGRWTFKGHRNWNRTHDTPESDYTPPERGNV